jgi:hypothetical protein
MTNLLSIRDSDEVLAFSPAYKQRITALANLVNKLKTFARREFQRMAPLDGFSSTMQTRQIAGSRGFPNGYVGALVKIWTSHRCSSFDFKKACDLS